MSMKWIKVNKSMCGMFLEVISLTLCSCVWPPLNGVLHIRWVTIQCIILYNGIRPGKDWSISYNFELNDFPYATWDRSFFLFNSYIFSYNHVYVVLILLCCDNWITDTKEFWTTRRLVLHFLMYLDKELSVFGHFCSCNPCQQQPPVCDVTSGRVT